MSFDQYYNQYGTEFGVSPDVLSNIAMLESSGNPNAVNDWDSNAQAGIPSQGLMQYIQPTFNTDYAAASAARPELFAQMGQKDWMNPQQQIASAAYAISQGKGDQWTTYDRAQGERMPTPTGKVEYGSAKQPSQPQRYRAGLTGDTGEFHMQKGMSPKQAQIAIAFQSSPELAEAYMNKQAQREAAAAQAQPAQGQPGAADMSNIGFDYADFPRLKGEPIWQWAQRMGTETWGLRNDPGTSQTTGGEHMKGSAHYGGRAIDFGDALNTRAQLDAAAAGYGQISGANVIWQAPGHYDHLHVGFQ